MQVEFLVNDSGVSILLAPENEMEEALVKQVTKQTNEITEIRMAITVLNRTYRNGVLIGKRIHGINQSVKDEKIKDEDQEETV